ncbi:MAG: calcium-binding protein [Phycisphaerales bacterium]|nr:calcium-binding protein [Phycisphaerales bacterium]
MHGSNMWIDALEPRRLLSHGHSHPHHQGHHDGQTTSQAVSVPLSPAGIIHIAVPAGNAVVRILRDAANPSTIDLSTNGKISSLGDIAKIKGIEVTAGNGNQAIEIVELNGAINIPVTLIGGAGNDTLVGGSGNDSLYAGQGSDLLSGQAGNDTLTGGQGSDTLLGGSGQNLIVESTGTYTVPANGGSETPGTNTIVHATQSSDGQSDQPAANQSGQPAKTHSHKHHKKEQKQNQDESGNHQRSHGD